jgi:hypothetical protein
MLILNGSRRCRMGRCGLISLAQNRGQWQWTVWFLVLWKSLNILKDSRKILLYGICSLEIRQYLIFNINTFSYFIKKTYSAALLNGTLCFKKNMIYCVFQWLGGSAHFLLFVLLKAATNLHPSNNSKSCHLGIRKENGSKLVYRKLISHSWWCYTMSSEVMRDYMPRVARSSLSGMTNIPSSKLEKNGISFLYIMKTLCFSSFFLFSFPPCHLFLDYCLFDDT